MLPSDLERVFSLLERGGEVFSFIGNHIPVLVGSFSSPLSTSLKNPISKTCESTHLVSSSTAVC